MRVAPVEQRRKKYLILPRGLAAHCAIATGACVLYATRIHATRETERFPIFPKDPASKTPLPEFSGLRMRDGERRVSHTIPHTTGLYGTVVFRSIP